jgi:hypothetical protein
VSERSCARCGVEIEHLRSDARFCGSGCRYRAWVERHPTEARQRLATLRQAYSARSTRRARKGAHGEHGVRIYLTVTDLDELRDLTGGTASPRLLRKVIEASERIERS